MRRTSATAAFILLCSYLAAVSAADWIPTKPMRLVVPVVGGTVDILARLVAPRLQDALGQPVIVENKPGAGGNSGTDFVAKSPADGHTLLVSFTAPITVNPTLFQKLPYDPQKDLAPIMLAVSTHQFLVVHPSVPAKTVPEFVRHLKANPGRLSYASIAVGGASHLTMEMFKAAAGVDIVHVPYKGSGPAITDLLAGNVHASMLVAGNVLAHLKSGKMRALAATGRQRFSSAPDVPTMIESGFADFDVIAWIGFHAPGGTSRDVIERINRELARALAVPEVRGRLASLEFEIVASSPEGFADYIRQETPRWARVIRDTGAKPE